ncbi:hypothetical protein CLF_101805 [Clonorchis sinensis]|uniref:Uncharacterized protein n=2 Tax=Clonorchis sinensis TaxID=79923 RepID=G7Y6L8_CLOSI|nr:hypothetical protein CLF_101805 [Clonorchis sinensis]
MSIFVEAPMLPPPDEGRVRKCQSEKPHTSIAQRLTVTAGTFLKTASPNTQAILANASTSVKGYAVNVVTLFVENLKPILHRSRTQVIVKQFLLTSSSYYSVRTSKTNSCGEKKLINYLGHRLRIARRLNDGKRRRLLDHTECEAYYTVANSFSTPSSVRIHNHKLLGAEASSFFETSCKRIYPAERFQIVPSNDAVSHFQNGIGFVLNPFNYGFEQRRARNHHEGSPARDNYSRNPNVHVREVRSIRCPVLASTTLCQGTKFGSYRTSRVLPLDLGKNDAIAVSFAPLDAPRHGTPTTSASLNMVLNDVRASHQRSEPEQFARYAMWHRSFVQQAGPQELPPFTFPPPINLTTDTSIVDYDQLPPATLLNLDAPAFHPTGFPEGIVTAGPEYPIVHDETAAAHISSSGEERTVPDVQSGKRRTVVVYDARHHPRTDAIDGTSTVASLQELLTDDKICA